MARTGNCYFCSNHSIHKWLCVTCKSLSGLLRFGLWLHGCNGRELHEIKFNRIFRHWILNLEAEYYWSFYMGMARHCGRPERGGEFIIPPSFVRIHPISLGLRFSLFLTVLHLAWPAGCLSICNLVSTLGCTPRCLWKLIGQRRQPASCRKP